MKVMHHVFKEFFIKIMHASIFLVKFQTPLYRSFESFNNKKRNIISTKIRKVIHLVNIFLLVGTIPSPYRENGLGKTSRRPKRRSTPQGLDQSSIWVSPQQRDMRNHILTSSSTGERKYGKTP